MEVDAKEISARNIIDQVELDEAMDSDTQEELLSQFQGLKTIETEVSLDGGYWDPSELFMP